MKRIYFAGAIRGSRVDAGLYARLIAHMKEKHIVLTEHIGSPTLIPTTEQAMTDQHIYAQDIGWLTDCDIVIAECTSPSLGVGYEMAYAEKLGKPTHIFFDKNRGYLSAMLAGNEYFHIHHYETECELLSLVDTVLEG